MSKASGKNLYLALGERVAAYRENTPGIIEWSGVVEAVRRHTGASIRVDGMTVAGGERKGQPVRVQFSATGLRLAPSYGPSLKIRRETGSSVVPPA